MANINYLGKKFKSQNINPKKENIKIVGGNHG